MSRRAIALLLIVLMLAPVAAGATSVSNTRVQSSQVGVERIVSEADGADWSIKFATTMTGVVPPGGRATDYAGSYTVPTAISVTKDNVYLDFYGVKLIGPSQTGDMITISGHNVTLAGVFIDASNMTGASCGIRVTGSNFTLRDALIVGPASGVCLAGAHNAVIDHATLISQATVGVSIASASKWVVLRSTKVQGGPLGVSISSDSIQATLYGNRFDTTASVTDSGTTTQRLDVAGWVLQDVSWQRDAVDRWKTPDDVIIGGGLGIGVASVSAKLSVSDGGAVAQSGLIAVPNNRGLYSRNAANNADLHLLSADTNNDLLIGGVGVADTIVRTRELMVDYTSGNSGLLINSGATGANTPYIDFARAGTITATIQSKNGSGLEFYDGSNLRWSMISGGLLDVTATGCNAGLRLGGDAQLCRGAANRIDVATGDSVSILSGSLNVNTGSNFRTTAPVVVGGDGAGSGATQFYVGADANPTFYQEVGGAMYWGAGGGTMADTTLSRGAADRLDLSSGDSFNIVSGSLLFAGETNLYRSAAYTLKTDASLVVGGTLAAGTWLFPTGISVGVSDPENGLIRGYTNTSTSTYVSRADGGNHFLALTDNGREAFRVRGGSTGAKAWLEWSDQAASPVYDTNLYRDGVSILASDGHIKAPSMAATTGLTVGVTRSSPNYAFGTAEFASQTMARPAASFRNTVGDNEVALAVYGGTQASLNDSRFNVTGGGSVTAATLTTTSMVNVGGNLNLGADAGFTRGAANRIDVLTGDSLNIVSGNFQIGATTLFESDRDFAVTLTPNADNTLAVGTSARRLSSVAANTHNVYASASDTQPSTSITSNSILLGPGGATAPDAGFTRGAANRIDVLTGDSLNIVSGNFQLGATTVFETDRDFAVNLTPNADNTLVVGTSARRLSSVSAKAYNVYDYAGDTYPSTSITSNSILLGSGAIAPDVGLWRNQYGQLAVKNGVDFQIGTYSLTPTSTSGYLILPSTGEAVTANPSSQASMYFDISNSKLCVFSSPSWRCVTLT